MYPLIQYLRFAFRQLWKTPGFSVTAILTLALGIGATTAMFSLVEGILLRPLPFHDPERLVLLGDHLGGHAAMSVTAPEIVTYSRAASVFSAMGAFTDAKYFLPRRFLQGELLRLTPSMLCARCKQP